MASKRVPVGSFRRIPSDGDHWKYKNKFPECSIGGCGRMIARNGLCQEHQPGMNAKG